MVQAIFTSEPLSREFQLDDAEIEADLDLFVKEAILDYRVCEKRGYAFLHDHPPTAAYVWRTEAILAAEAAATAHIENKHAQRLKAESDALKSQMHTRR
jgi:hypothetical protein